MNNPENIKELKIHSNPLLRWILIISGVLLVGIGILGMFLPILPTTVFFLLAAWCFARSSEKFYKWLHENRLFGKYLSNYSRGNGMTLKSKAFSLSVLWLGIGYSSIFATSLLYVRILLLLIAVAVTWHILAIKTFRE
ncbi:MAG TPA: YbaN family protein [Ignavibacteria bacterium]|nr:YbaN family protein [Ignavibacteria bacterium]